MSQVKSPPKFDIGSPIPVRPSPAPISKPKGTPSSAKSGTLDDTHHLYGEMSRDEVGRALDFDNTLHEYGEMSAVKDELSDITLNSLNQSKDQKDEEDKSAGKRGRRRRRKSSKKKRRPRKSPRRRNKRKTRRRRRR